MRKMKQLMKNVLAAGCALIMACAQEEQTNPEARAMGVALEGRVERNKQAWARTVSALEDRPTTAPTRKDLERVVSGYNAFWIQPDLHLILRSEARYNLDGQMEYGAGLGEEDYQRMVERMGEIVVYAQSELGIAPHAAYAVSRRHQETDIGAVNADVDIPVDAAMVQTFIDAIGALIGALASLPGAFADIGLCLGEEGKRVLPWILAEMYQENPEGLECSSRCVASSAVPLSGWCIAHSGDFIRAGGHLEVAPDMRDYVNQVCDDIRDNDPSDPNYFCGY